MYSLMTMIPIITVYATSYSAPIYTINCPFAMEAFVYITFMTPENKYFTSVHMRYANFPWMSPFHTTLY